jgi:2-keto-4-pentenoate hydratase
MHDQHSRAAADLLLEARERGTALDVEGLACAPESLDQVYAIQALVAPALGAVGGWKVAGPAFAPLAASGVLASPAALPAARFPLRGIEVEVGYRLGADLPGRDAPYGEEEVAAAVDAVLATIEVVESRLVDRERAGALWALADNQSHGALVLGPLHQGAWRAFDVAELHVELGFDGETIVDRLCHNAAGPPLEQLVMLANACRGHCGGLRKGQIVTTGSLMGIEYAPPGARVRAVVERLGEVEVGFG